MRDLMVELSVAEQQLRAAANQLGDLRRDARAMLMEGNLLDLPVSGVEVEAEDLEPVVAGVESAMARLMRLVAP